MWLALYNKLLCITVQKLAKGNSINMPEEIKIFIVNHSYIFFYIIYQNFYSVLCAEQYEQKNATD